jgi:VWFA-related protein
MVLVNIKVAFVSPPSLRSKNKMKKLALALHLSLLLILSFQSLYAQTRDRRVGSGNSTDKGSEEVRSSIPESSGVGSTTEDDIIRVETTLVTVPVTVMDRSGKYVPNLTQSDFHIFEDGKEQEIAYFNSTEQPFTVVLLIDTSRSTQFKLEDIQDAAISFVNQLRPADQVMVVSFDETIKTLTEPTNDRHELIRAIRRTRIGRGTALYDAIHLVLNHHIGNITSGRKKAIVLFTDGVDTTSRRATYAGTLHDAEEGEALIYPIQYDTYVDNRQDNQWPFPRRDPGVIVPRWPFPFPRRPWPFASGNASPLFMNAMQGGRSREEYRRANNYLRELAQKTGTRVYQAETIKNVEEAFNLIAEELRRQYSIGYYPKNAAQSGQRRQIKVKVKQPNLVVRARDSYISQPKS